MEHLAAIGVLAALTAAFFFPVIFQAKSITVVRSFEPIEYPWRAVEAPQQLAIQSDEADLSYPWQVELTRAVQQGTIPLWDPDGFVGGYPLYSNGSSAELYPLRLLPALVMSPVEAHNLMCILEVFFVGFFVYLFLRELEVGVVAAIFGGVAWMFCSFNMAWLQFDVVSPIQMLFPLGLLVVHRSWRKSTWTSALIAGAVFGVTMLSGHVVWLGITCLICGLYAFALGAGSALGAWREGDRAAATHFIAIPLLSVASAAGVSAIGLLPVVDGLAASQRHTFPYSYLGGFVAQDASFGLSPHSVFAHLFYPYKTPLTIEGINLEMIFSGTATAVFAVIGLFSRRPGTALGKWLLFALLLVAVGTPVSWLAYHTVPLLRVLWPYGRLLQWASMGLVLLGAIGLDRTLARLATVRLGTERVRVVAVGALGVAVVTCTAFQLIPLGRSLNPPFATLTRQNTFPETRLVRAMEDYTRNGPWPSRILPVSSEAPFGGGLMLAPGNFGLLYDVDLVDGYDSVVPQRIAAVDRFLEGTPPSQVSSLQFEAFSTFPLDSEVRYDELQRFGISALATVPADTAVGDWGDLAV